MRLEIPSFSKINLWLEVLGRREDGYHELRTVFQTLDLHESIDLESTAAAGIELEVEGREVPRGPENLVFRAAELYRERTGWRTGVRLLLHKRLPVGAGLGAGSGNAAATLAGLNVLAGDLLSRCELAELAAALGSDVPFFLWGGTALGRGRGEIIQPLPDFSIEVAILLVWPGFQVPTAQVYGSLEARPYRAPEKLTSEDPGTKIREFFSTRYAGRWGALRNDLEAPVVRQYPELGRLKHCLLASGCREVLLAGSGSTVFGMGDSAALQRAAEKCRAAGWSQTYLCHPLSSQQYYRRWAAAGIRLRDR
ncbi:MAG: 4-(cytidine 5'-diphospho)-2-C-methyl-D-erythritol kinase [Acidobacteriota bacterium]